MAGLGEDSNTAVGSGTYPTAGVDVALEAYVPPKLEK